MSEEPPEPETLTLKQSLRLLRHRLLGKLFEIVLTPHDILVQSEIQMMKEPPRADLLLLRRKGKKWSEQQRNLLPDGIRDRHASQHLLECKFSESVNHWVFQQALGYDVFHLRTQRLKPTQLQTYIISAKTPDKELLNQLSYRNDGPPGVYVTSQPILSRIVLIVLNELSDAAHNDFIRLFASRQKVRKQTLKEVTQRDIADWSDEFWSIIFGLQRVYDLEGDAMKSELTVDDVMEIGNTIRKKIIASASPADRLAGLAAEDRLAGLAAEDRLAGLSAEDRLAGLSAEDRLAGLAAEDRLAGLAAEDRLAGLAAEEMEALFEQLEALLSKQPIRRNPRHSHRRNV